MVFWSDRRSSADADAIVMSIQGRIERGPAAEIVMDRHGDTHPRLPRN
jgi:hypothetical protein